MTVNNQREAENFRTAKKPSQNVIPAQHLDKLNRGATGIPTVFSSTHERTSYVKMPRFALIRRPTVFHRDYTTGHEKIAITYGGQKLFANRVTKLDRKMQSRQHERDAQLFEIKSMGKFRFTVCFQVLVPTRGVFVNNYGDNTKVMVWVSCSTHLHIHSITCSSVRSVRTNLISYSKLENYKWFFNH